MGGIAGGACVGDPGPEAMVGSTELGSTRVPGISGGAPGTPTDGIATVPIDAISPADVV
jgi:hypothetical protein